MSQLTIGFNDRADVNRVLKGDNPELQHRGIE